LGARTRKKDEAAHVIGLRIHRDGEDQTMAKHGEPYRWIVVESYRPGSTAGLHGEVHIRPISGQGVRTDLHVECSKKLSENYPIGTRFRIKAKLTDKEGGGEFLYSYFGWAYDTVE
jgi:PII-like signaling protein